MDILRVRIGGRDPHGQAFYAWLEITPGQTPRQAASEQFGGWDVGTLGDADEEAPGWWDRRVTVWDITHGL